MIANPYKILGPSIQPMLGRGALVRQIERHLLKPSPDHVSVVGPKHYGKSVLLRHLAGTYLLGPTGYRVLPPDEPAELAGTDRWGRSDYLATVYIDLQHDTPGSDGAFRRRFAEEIKATFQPDLWGLSDHPALWDSLEMFELPEYLDLENETSHESLDLVFTELEDRGARMLVVLDGLDYALFGTGLTRNLWDQLRSLAQKTSLRFVTGSRRPLRKLCKTEESRTSDFWEVFYDTPIRVAALDDSDWDAFLQPLLDAGCALDESARKEIANWTGGVPLLVCALLQKLWEQYRATPRLSKPEIDRAAGAVLGERRELLAELWDDCDVELRADLGALAAADIPVGDLSDGRRRALESRGFGRISKNRLRSSCRMMQHYAEERAPALADLTRLFGSSPDFEAHIRSLLELRLAQVARPGVDRDLRESVRNAVRDIEPDPKHALVWIRSIADRALALIWDAELPRSRTLPPKWLDEWRHAGVKSLPEDGGKLPYGSGLQCGVLRLITGTDRVRRQSRYVTKTTSLLVDHLQSVGSFGQHRENFPETNVSIGFAAASVLAAISLVENLTADLHREGGTSRDTT